jgi:site-specific DNA-methyltransferase (adenine-specific)
MRENRPKLVLNSRQTMNGFAMLRAMEDESAALAVFDPQYRAVLNKLEFGNEGHRQQRRADLPQMKDGDIALFVEQIERVLRASGHLAFWIDKYSIGSGHHLKYFRYSTLKIVDLIAWNTLRFGMGRRSRGSTEFLIIAQKYPVRAKGVWTDNSIRDAWIESSDRAEHPHAKPYQLTERIIRATTRRDDLVVDPCAGSYVVLEACRATGRNFMGCDLRGE